MLPFVASAFSQQAGTAGLLDHFLRILWYRRVTLFLWAHHSETALPVSATCIADIPQHILRILTSAVTVLCCCYTFCLFTLRWSCFLIYHLFTKHCWRTLSMQNIVICEYVSSVIAYCIALVTLCTLQYTYTLMHDAGVTLRHTEVCLPTEYSSPVSTL